MSLTPSAGRSLAIWCTPPSTEEGKEDKGIQLHFNYWRLGSGEPGSRKVRKGKSKAAHAPDILDIGLMIPSHKGLDKVFIYLPFAVSRDDIEDIGSSFEDQSIATGIFNERLDVTKQSGEQRYIYLKEKEGNNFCIVYTFNSDSEVKEISPQDLVLEKTNEGGSILSIGDNALSDIRRKDGETFYFRFRILLRNPNQSFVKEILPGDNKLLSGFDSINFVDFRLNEPRNLPDSVEKKMISCKSMPVKRIDLLLVVKVEADIVGGDKGFHKSRLLEPGLWEKYLGKERSIFLTEGMVIYHWRDKVKDGATRIDDFNAFVKLKVRHSTKSTIRRYLCYAFFIGFLGSLAGSMVYSGAPTWAKTWYDDASKWVSDYVSQPRPEEAKVGENSE